MKKPETRVAVYGTLRRGGHNHYLLQEDSKKSELLGRTYVKDKYTMYNLGTFPALVKEGEHSIYLEVYRVDKDIFEKLDALEGYPNWYKRELIDTVFGKAWIYYLEEPHGDKMECGFWPVREVDQTNFRDCVQHEQEDLRDLI